MKLASFAFALLLACTPALAQQTAVHSVPIGKGAGNTGFNAAVPGTAGRPLVSQGATSDPVFGTIANSGFTAGPANTVKGSLDGVSVGDEALPACTGVNQALRWTAGVGFSCGVVSVNTGYDMPVNLGLSASASGDILTLTLTQANGSAPTSTNPVLVPFRSTVATTGTVTWTTISASQSIAIPQGATLGTSNGNIPFRVWIFEEYNGGSPVMAVATCSNTTNVFPCAAWESSLVTSVTLSGGGSSDNSGVLYATTGVSADAVRIIGYCDYATGVSVGGTWASSCTSLQVFGPGVNKPGSVVQTVYGTTSTQTTTTSASYVASNLTASITPTRSANLVRVSADGVVRTDASGSANVSAIFRGAAAAQVGASQFLLQSSGAFALIAPSHWSGLDAPGTTSSTAYTVYVKSTSGATVTVFQTGSAGGTNPLASILIEEIMG